jgi:L-asparaginase II
MTTPDHKPLFVLTRGEIVESIHYGSIAVVDKEGVLRASAGDPSAVTFLRSTAKPFQLLPFLANGGASYYHLEPQEIAVMSASHSGSDEHFAVVSGLQSKIGIGEADLLCGVHPPYDESTNEAMRARGEEPSPNRHNCSGKHTGMLAYARMMGWPTSDYINPDHPVQQSILKTFAMICDLEVEQVRLGIDGCSAPNFAVPAGTLRSCLPPDHCSDGHPSGHDRRV